MIAVTVCFDWSSCSCLYFSRARSRSWALRLLYTSLCLRKYIAVGKFAMTLSEMNCLRRCIRAMTISGSNSRERGQEMQARNATGYSWSGFQTVPLQLNISCVPILLSVLSWV